MFELILSWPLGWLCGSPFDVAWRDGRGCVVIAAEAVEVTDGDTLKIDGQRIRLIGYDAPEPRRAKCDAEKALGLASTKATVQLFSEAGRVTFVFEGVDRYDRPLAHIWIDGRPMGEALRELGLAARWDYAGGESKPFWRGE